jgi:hypothetical protein
MGLFDRRSPFRRRRDNTFTVELADEGRQLIGDLLTQLRDLLTSDSPALVRLFPPPYGDDEERNQGYAALAGAELVERRIAAIDAMESTLRSETLTEDELAVWMRSINDIRLVLGTILDVSEDHEPPDVTDDAAPLYATYEYLGYLLDRVVAALSS